jgi:Fe2+ transport system protein B
MSKPKLVDPKIIEKIIKVQEENKSFNFKINEILYRFFLNNLFGIFIFVFVILLLIYRYFDVKSKKNKKKNIIDDSSDSDSDSDY